MVAWTSPISILVIPKEKLTQWEDEYEETLGNLLQRDNIWSTGVWQIRIHAEQGKKPHGHLIGGLHLIEAS